MESTPASLVLILTPCCRGSTSIENTSPVHPWRPLVLQNFTLPKMSTLEEAGGKGERTWRWEESPVPSVRKTPLSGTRVGVCIRACIWVFTTQTWSQLSSSVQPCIKVTCSLGWWTGRLATLLVHQRVPLGASLEKCLTSQLCSRLELLFSPRNRLVMSPRARSDRLGPHPRQVSKACLPQGAPPSSL